MFYRQMELTPGLRRAAERKIKMAKRVFLIVLDSAGVGYEPDAERFGDVGSDTFGTCIRSGRLSVPNMEKMGLYQIEGTSFERREADAQGNQNAIAVTGSNGSYTVNPVQTGEGLSYDMVSASADVGTGFNLKLNGLAAGDYWIVETDAPEGYNGVTAPIKVTVTASADNDVNNWTISKNDNAETDKVIDIENSTGSILPGTGGMGTILFTVIGVALVIAVAGSFVVSRRRKAE